MLIAQLTDIHVGFDRDQREETNVLRLRAVLDRLANGPNRPDILLLSGDLTERGDAESYTILLEELQALPLPTYAIPGNHDTREGLLTAFPLAQVTAGGFVQYAVEANGLRILMLDTLDPARHAGGFCAARADWLARELAAHPDTPTFIVLHHPPFTAGIPWMDTDCAEGWVARLAEAVAGHSQIVAITSGHLHRAVTSRWMGQATMICPSTAPPVALDLNPIDPERPDGRVLISAEPAGYALHRWDGRNLVSHFEWIGGLDAIASYSPALQGMIREFLAERPS